MKGLVILANLVFFLIGLGAIFLALTAVMIFDAPGSEQNPYAWIMFWSAITLPFTCFSSVLASLCFFLKYRHYEKALWVMLIPWLNIAILVGSMAWVQFFCAGNFSCHYGYVGHSIT